MSKDALIKIKQARSVVRNLLRQPRYLKKYYTNTLQIMAQAKEDSKNLLTTTQLDILEKYYKDALTMLDQWKEVSKSASLNDLWTLNAKKVVDTFENLEKNYRVTWKSLATTPSQPESILNRDKRLSNLQNLDEQLEKELNELVNRAHQTYEAAFNFNSEQYLERVDLIERLEAIKNTNIDKLLFKWIIFK